MYLDKLKIYNDEKIIRDIPFKSGLNMILDSTDSSQLTDTGNNIGKTTVLSVIDYCLGGVEKNIYVDHETKKDYVMVKNFLKEKEIIIELSLINDRDEKITLKRNFLSGKKKIMSINSNEYTNIDNYKSDLKKILFPSFKESKPTFKQLKAGNLRYKPERINNTIKYLNQNTTSFEYEVLILSLLGMPIESAIDKEKLKKDMGKEKDFANKLQLSRKKNEYESLLRAVNNEISQLEEDKQKLEIDNDIAKNIEALNYCKYQLAKKRRSFTNTDLKLNLINDSINALSEQKSNIDINELKFLYDETIKLDIKVSKTFEDLFVFHNEMIQNKRTYLEKEIPILKDKLLELGKEIELLSKEERDLTAITVNSVSVFNLEEIIEKLTIRYKDKGEYETYIKEIEGAEKKIENYSSQLDLLNKDLHSEEYKIQLKNRIDSFNDFYNDISETLYNEKFFLTFETSIDKKSQKSYYKFQTFNENFGNGKKQGEITAFDIAYILFCRAHNISTLDFILNDQKELMHVNQLEKLSELLFDYNIQVVISILSDKLSPKLLQSNSDILTLSENDKLFRIESYSSI